MTRESFWTRFRSKSPFLITDWYCRFLSSGRLVSIIPFTKYFVYFWAISRFCKNLTFVNLGMNTASCNEWSKFFVDKSCTNTKGLCHVVQTHWIVGLNTVVLHPRLPAILIYLELLIISQDSHFSSVIFVMWIQKSVHFQFLFNECQASEKLKIFSISIILSIIKLTVWNCEL